MFFEVQVAEACCSKGRSASRWEIVRILQKEMAGGWFLFCFVSFLRGMMTPGWLSGSDGKGHQFRDKMGIVLSFSASCALRGEESSRIKRVPFSRIIS